MSDGARSRYVNFLSPIGRFSITVRDKTFHHRVLGRQQRVGFINRLCVAER